MYTQAARAQRCANHVQHIQRLSRARSPFHHASPRQKPQLEPLCYHRQIPAHGCGLVSRHRASVGLSVSALWLTAHTCLLANGGGFPHHANTLCVRCHLGKRERGEREREREREREAGGGGGGGAYTSWLASWTRLTDWGRWKCD